MYLRRLIKELELQKAGLSEVAMIRRIEDRILWLQGGIEELKQWSRELDLDPGYGMLILDKDNIHRPKLPTFTTAAERTQALTNRTETLTGMSEVDVRRAREFRAREDAEVSLKNMDGRSPYIPEEERKQPRGTV
jgi:hypothetical protein